VAEQSGLKAGGSGVGAANPGEGNAQQVVNDPPGSVFYRYQAPGGRLMLVDSLDKLPPEAREHAERIGLPGRSDGASLVNTPPTTAVGNLDTLTDAAKSLLTAPATSAEKQSAASSAAGTLADSKVGSVAEPTKFQLDPASFGLGLGAGLLVAMLLAMLARRGSESGGWRWVIRATVLGAVVFIAAGGYLGWVRRTAGVGTEGLAGPQTLVDDARAAVEQVKQKREAQLKELEELDKLAK
jgi:hypothetical protein